MGEATELLKEMVSLLREIAQCQQRDTTAREEISKRVGTHDFSKRTEDFEKRRQEHERRFQELRDQGDKHRREDLKFREQLLASMQELTDVLRRLEGKLK